MTCEENVTPIVDETRWCAGGKEKESDARGLTREERWRRSCMVELLVEDPKNNSITYKYIFKVANSDFLRASEVRLGQFQLSRTPQFEHTNCLRCSPSISSEIASRLVHTSDAYVVILTLCVPRRSLGVEFINLIQSFSFSFDKTR